MWRHSLLAALLLVAIFPSSISAQRAAGTNKRSDRIIRAVRTVLDAQVEAWNRGDIEGYMAGYRRSEETVFVSGDSLTRGWQTVLARYKKNYDSREKMGTLTFSDLEITPIGSDAAIAVGRWHLQRAKDEPHGRFTLIFRKTRQGWRIVHDHTSSAN
jgi:ketosteroid isomerase-like protein